MNKERLVKVSVVIGVNVIFSIALVTCSVLVAIYFDKLTPHGVIAGDSDVFGDFDSKQLELIRLYENSLNSYAVVMQRANSLISYGFISSAMLMLLNCIIIYSVATSEKHFRK